MKRYAALIIISAMLLLCVGMSWLIVEGTRGEPGLQSWQGPLDIDIYSGSDYTIIFIDHHKAR